MSLLMTLNLKHIKIPCRNPAACNTLDESGGHYNKWNKPYRKEQKLYDVWFHSHEASRIIISEGSDYNVDCQWLEGKGNREFSLSV